MLRKDILEIKKSMDVDGIPIEGRSVNCPWPEMIPLIVEHMGDMQVDSWEYRQCERALNAISVGNYDAAVMFCPDQAYGIKIIPGVSDESDSSY